MKNYLRLALLLAFVASRAWGQFELFLVNGSLVQPVPQTYNMGNVAPGTAASATFQITNISNTPSTLNLLTVTGAGFSVSKSNAPSLPASLAPQQSVAFTVVFQASGTGIFNAALNSVGISVTLTAVVPVELTYEWINGNGVQLLSAGPVNFGSVPVGQSPAIEVLLLNQTSVALAVPVVGVSGTGFSLAGPPPAGTIAAAASIAVNIQFNPATVGGAAGTLLIGGQTFALSGTGTQPALPQPQIAIALPEALSGQQGTVAVNLSATAQTYATGTVTLSFQPNASIPNATDPGIAFASGGQSATFNVFIGTAQASFDNQSTLPFATGTTAGTLTVTVTLGGNTVQQSITILPAAVAVTAAQGVRSASSVEVDLTGFDNTRTAGALSFTFFDANGNQVAPPVTANGSSAFAAYFANSAGGTFVLKAVFPVSGGTGSIASFQASVTNSAGATTTAITNF